MAERKCQPIAAGTSAATPSPNAARFVNIPIDGAGDTGSGSMKELEGASHSDAAVNQRDHRAGTTRTTRRSIAGDGDDDGLASPVHPRQNQLTGSSSSQLAPLPEQENVAVRFVNNEGGGNGGELTISGASTSRSVRNTDPAYQLRVRKRLWYGGGSNLKVFQFPSWLSTNVDILTEILAWLPPERIVQAASASRNFKEVVTSHDFRSLVRRHSSQNSYLLGIFPKCSTDKPEKYPFVRYKGLPRAFINASSFVRTSWNQYWKYTELMDSRDGRLLLLAGNSRRSCGFVIYNPLSWTNSYSQLPKLALLDEPNFRLVAAALVPDDRSHCFRVIVLTRRGEADTKVKLNAPATEASVVCFSSSTGIWGDPVNAWFEMPTKSMLHLGSLLLENTLYFLHSCGKVITVDIASLELGMLKLPVVKNIRSRTSHVLTRGPSNQVYLAVVSRRNIAMYSRDGNDWSLKLISPSPGHAKNVAVKLVGSTDRTGLIFVKADGQVIYKMEVQSGSFDLISDNVHEEEVLPYELEYPPVSQMLRQQQHVD